MKVNVEKFENLLEAFAVSAGADALQAIERACFGDADVEARFRDKRIPFSILKKILLDNSTGQLGVRIRVALQEMEDRCSAVLLVVKTGNLEAQADGRYRIKSKALKDRTRSGIPICPDIPYGEEQSMSALGTAFFVAENVIATAAHLLLNIEDLNKDIRFICCPDFDSSVTEVLVSEDQIFTPSDATLKNYDFTNTNQDWALVELEPQVNHNVRTLSLSSKMPFFKQSVYVIGHGLSLSKKISYSGELIKHDRTKDFFECAVSSFSGNSGSPVFDMETNEVIGIVVRANKKITFCNTRKCIVIKNVLSEFEGVECQLIKTVAASLAKMKSTLTIDIEVLIGV